MNQVEIAVIASVLGVALLVWIVLGECCWVFRGTLKFWLYLYLGFLFIRHLRRDKPIQNTVGGVPVPWNRRERKVVREKRDEEKHDEERIIGSSPVSAPTDPQPLDAFSDPDLQTPRGRETRPSEDVSRQTLSSRHFDHDQNNTQYQSTPSGLSQAAISRKFICSSYHMLIPHSIS